MASRRPATGKSPTKSQSQSFVQSVTRSDEIVQQHGLTVTRVEQSHDATTQYLIAQHKVVVDDLRRDNELLRQENEMLK